MRAKYRVELQTEDQILIKDIGEDCMSVTNDAEAVIRDLHRNGLLGDRRLLYADSEGTVDELKHDGERQVRRLRSGAQEMKDDDPDKLEEKHVSLFVEKFRATALKDPLLALDIIEVLIASFRQDQKEDPFQIARTICEILEPERLGGIVWWNCSVCREKLEDQEVEKKSNLCERCRLMGHEPESGP